MYIYLYIFMYIYMHLCSFLCACHPFKNNVNAVTSIPSLLSHLHQMTLMIHRWKLMGEVNVDEWSCIQLTHNYNKGLFPFQDGGSSRLWLEYELYPNLILENKYMNIKIKWQCIFCTLCNYNVIYGLKNNDCLNCNVMHKVVSTYLISQT